MTVGDRNQEKVTSLLTQLLALAPPPDYPLFAGTPSRWDEVEHKIGTALPQDYKSLVNLYGLGSFGGYICLLNPFVPDLGPNSLSNFYRAMNFLNEMDYLRLETPDDRPPLPPYPSLGGLLPWGQECSDGGIQCWLTKGTPDEWGCIILDGDWSEEYHEYSSTATGFLVGWLTGQIVISYYPELPLEKPLFQPFEML